jgi:DNA-binding transcriptional regulator PaaX
MRNKTTITDLLIATLCSGRNTKTFYKILHEREFGKYRKESLRVALSRLHKNGYINNSTSGWLITKKGQNRFKKNNEKSLLDYLPSPFKKNSPQNMIISFDIPEKNRKIRYWLRSQLKIFGYKMLQQSLWIGPGPLPPLFLIRIEKLDIRKNIKIFKISKKI